MKVILYVNLLGMFWAVDGVITYVQQTIIDFFFFAILRPLFSSSEASEVTERSENFLGELFIFIATLRIYVFLL